METGAAEGSEARQHGTRSAHGPVFVLQRTGEELSVYIHARVLTPLLPYRKYYGKYATDPRDVPQKIRKLNTYLF